MKLATITACLVVLLAGCSSETDPVPNQCIRTDLFKQCMAALPKGPDILTDTKNKWDDVVDSCETAAYRQSMRIRKAIPLECQAY